MTQARRAPFYLAWGVPDTVQGRFEILIVHVSLLLDRLQQEVDGDAELARALSEAFIADMDASMREMTFSDLAVPREIKRTAAALFDRHTAYQPPLRARQPAALAASLASEMAYLAAGCRLDVTPLAHYMLATAERMARQPAAELRAGRPAWPAL